MFHPSFYAFSKHCKRWISYSHSTASALAIARGSKFTSTNYINNLFGWNFQHARCFASSKPENNPDEFGVVSEHRADLTEVLELLKEKKAENISVLDSAILSSLGSLCRYMVVVTCTSKRHMGVVSNYITEHYKLKGLLLEFEDDNGKLAALPPRVEGADSDCWMLVDLGDIIVQIFSQEGRDNYRLEEHWADVQAARDAGLSYETYIDKKGAAAAAVAATIRGGDSSEEHSLNEGRIDTKRS